MMQQFKAQARFINPLMGLSDLMGHANTTLHQPLSSAFSASLPNSAVVSETCFDSELCNSIRQKSGNN